MLVGDAKIALKAFGFDDTDPLLIWLEAAKSDFEGRDDWPFLIKTAALIPMAIGVISVSGGTLPADIFKVMSVRDNTQGLKLQELDPLAYDRDLDNPNEPGLPQNYSVFASAVAPGLNLAIWPASTQAWSLQLRYQATMTDITTLGDGVQMPGPVQMHYAYVQGAAAIALQADNEEDRAATAQQLFESKISSWRRKTFSDIDEPSTVQNVMGY